MLSRGRPRLASQASPRESAMDPAPRLVNWLKLGRRIYSVSEWSSHQTRRTVRRAAASWLELVRMRPLGVEGTDGT
jgi:hypothetical protein